MSNINAGKYRWPSTLYKTPSAGDFSGESLKPEALRQLWVQLVPRSSAETNATQGMESVDTVELRTPWTPEPIDSSMAIANERGWFEIEGVVNDADANIEYVITATKRPIDGSCA